MRAAYIIFCVIVGVVGAYFGSPLIHDNTDAITILVTVYTVFAGLLVAVIVILGDPMLLPGNWKAAEAHRSNIRRRLIRHGWLFGVYLLTIGMIFLSALFKKSTVPDVIKSGIEATFLGMAIAAFFLSLALPKMLIDVQQARVDADIDRKRGEEGINPGE